MEPAQIAVNIVELTKSFENTLAVDNLGLQIPRGSFYGIVGPNGAGKTTTLSMVTGLLRPDHGTVMVAGKDVWADPYAAKQVFGVLPDGVRTFDRLTGAQLLTYTGRLRKLPAEIVAQRTATLLKAFGLEDAADKQVADYSAGMTKKINLAAAMIHAPEVLVLDEPFESVDPVSSSNIIEILKSFTSSGGTVVLSSHVMDLVQRICDDVAMIVHGHVLANGTVDEVRGGKDLQDRFVELAGGIHHAEGLEWLRSS